MSNKKIIYGLIGVTILLMGILVYGISKRGDTTDPNLSQYLKEEKQIMDDMMKEMEEIPQTGDPAINFLYGMIPHHNAAIKMAEALLQYGGNDETIKKIAEDVIKVQAEENKQMEALILELEKNPQLNKEQEEAYLKEYNGMFHGSMSTHGEMSGKGVKTKSVDSGFAEGMISHHEMAIEMSESILKYTDNEVIQEMAKKIIEVQKEEIEVMKALIK